MARFLYILSREDSGQSEQIFAWLRRDMESAAVELILDRRHGEPLLVDPVVTERRQHRPSVEESLARLGWARVRIE